MWLRGMIEKFEISLFFMKKISLKNLGKNIPRIYILYIIIPAKIKNLYSQVENFKVYYIFYKLKRLLNVFEILWIFHTYVYKVAALQYRIW